MAKQRIEIEVDVPEGWVINRQSSRNEILPILPVEHGCSKQLVCGLILRKIEPERESRWINAYRCDHTNEGANRYPNRVLAKSVQGDIRAPLIRIDYENGVPVHVALEPAEGEG